MKNLFLEFGKKQQDLATGSTLMTLMTDENAVVVPSKEGDLIRQGTYGKYILARNGEKQSLFLGLSEAVEDKSMFELLSLPIYAGESANGKWVRIGAEGGNQANALDITALRALFAKEEVTLDA